MIVRQANAGVLAGLDLGDEAAVGKGDEERGVLAIASRGNAGVGPHGDLAAPRRLSRSRRAQLAATAASAAALVFPCQSGKS